MTALPMCVWLLRRNQYQNLQAAVISIFISTIAHMTLWLPIALRSFLTSLRYVLLQPTSLKPVCPSLQIKAPRAIHVYKAIYFPPCVCFRARSTGLYQRRRWNRNTTLEPYCNVPWFYKFYLKCRVSFSVLDLYVSGISARCNQATVAFLRLIATLFFSITQVTWCSYFIFYFVSLTPEKARPGRACWE